EQSSWHQILNIKIPFFNILQRPNDSAHACRGSCIAGSCLLAVISSQKFTILSARGGYRGG
ncbi:MAG: hypothetical protein D4R93_01195, partial [Deltaproteobacteria bacterium]